MEVHGKGDAAYFFAPVAYELLERAPHFVHVKLLRSVLTLVISGIRRRMCVWSMGMRVSVPGMPRVRPVRVRVAVTRTRRSCRGATTVF